MFVRQPFHPKSVWNVCAPPSGGAAPGFISTRRPSSPVSVAHGQTDLFPFLLIRRCMELCSTDAHTFWYTYNTTPKIQNTCRGTPSAMGRTHGPKPASLHFPIASKSIRFKLLHTETTGIIKQTLSMLHILCVFLVVRDGTRISFVYPPFPLPASAALIHIFQ